MSDHLDRYPNLALDLADRICHLQVQSLSDWQKVHDFFVRYQDRILYGTDLEPVDSIVTEIPQTAHEVWLRDWKYLVTDDVMTSPQVTGSFKGLKLEKSIVDKIYFNNALEWYPKVKEGI